MSKIYKRPMFRGGGKVSSYGNGIATGLADGGRPGYETGGDIMSKISGANTLFTDGGGGAKKKIFGIEIPGTGEALDREGNPYDPKYIQEELNKTKDEINTLLSFTPVGRSARGLNVVRSPYSKFPGFRSGLPSASKVKDFFTKSPESLNRGLGPYKGKSPIGTDRFFSEKLRPAFQNTGQALKDLLGGAGKLKDYKTAIGVGGIGGTYGLAKGYEAFKERQKPLLDGINGEETELTSDQQKINDLLEQLRLSKIEQEPSSDIYKETLVGKKARLKESAKEYEEILGDGIKKDSIFDAMVTGGTALMEGQGFAGAAREANKSLNPIQNIKTASRKLALEEDIALRKALTVSKNKETETSRKIAAMKDGDYTKKEIADAVAGIKKKSIGEESKDAGSKTEGYRNWHIKNAPEIKVTEFTEVKDIEKAAENLPNGVYYVTFPGDTYVKIEGKKVVAKKRRGG